ncbi:Hypothetical protein CAP_1246 [Chondromyces apiculatus DSM 436]|uniref:Uncharacterized protein n=2 Tax=Chondromyces apiculatus TaxID=51 RepID=A0A017TDJ9_9BACT|nr:Hypothetical protein CAP_1246 [Chondromyces apiculatus DSM 436]
MHRVTSLDSVEGRGKLLDEVWGPPSARRRARQLARAGGGGVGVGSVLEGCTSCGGCDVPDGEALIVVAVIALIGAVCMALYWVVMKIVEAIRAHQNRPKPHGGLLRPASVGRRVGPAGVITRVLPDPQAAPGVGPRLLEAPASGVGCAAYAVDLSCKRFLRAGLMLHTAESAGFEVRLDDGSVAHVPAGRIRLEGPMERRSRGSAPAVARYVEELAPRNPEPDDDALFPYDTVQELVLQPGDRVRLFGEFERIVDAGAAGSYRGGAQAILMPVGVPALRREPKGE